MTLPEFEHFEPKTLSEACFLLKKYRDRAKVIAGGTDLLNLMRNRLVEAEYLIDLKRILELRDLSFDEKKGLVIGSTNTLSGLINSPLVREKAPLLIEAAKSVAAPPLQNMGTIGGNVCLNTRCFFYNQSKFWRSSRPGCFKVGGSICHVVKNSKQCHSVFRADAACALVALKAEIRLVEEGEERTLPLAEFYTGKGEIPNRLRPTEILTEIIIPPDDHSMGGYEKLRSRAALDFPQVGVAATLSYDLERRIKEVMIVLNAIAPHPIELKAARGLLIGKRLDENLIKKIAQLAFEAIHPANNTGVSSLYRKRMTRILVRQTLKKSMDSYQETFKPHAEQSLIKGET
jgi:4-hydroxybenzoyl-CoA reductase subunit beta